MPYVSELQNLILNRKSIRSYDKTKIISDNKINDILNYVHHIPSSYGLEPWKIVVINNKKMQRKLQPMINNQTQVSNCSHLFILLSNSGQTFNTSNQWFIDTVMKKHNLTMTGYESYQKTFNNFFDIKQARKISYWTQCQTFMLLQNLLLLLTAHEIDSVVLGGFKESQIITYLETNKIIPVNQYHITVLVCAGYGNNVIAPRKIMKCNAKDISVVIK